MNWPDRGTAIANALYAINPGLTIGTDEQQRLFVRLVAEQMAFELGRQWGVKSASPTRPQGPSEIAYQGPPLQIWRLIDNDGHVTGTPGAILPQPLQQPADQSVGQTFIAVTPSDHLSTTVPDPPPVTMPKPDLLPPLYLSTLNAILSRLDKIDAELVQLQSEHVALSQQVYRTTLWSFPIVLKPGPP